MYTKLLFVNPRYPFCSKILSKRHGALARPGFTLIELLVVVAVIVLMTSLAIPAFDAIRGGTDFTSEVYEIAGLFDQARAYATANNTYVLAGIKEVSAAQDTSANPQVTGTGRVAVAVVAAKSGARPYQYYFSNPNAPLTWTTSGYGSGSAYVAVTNLMPFQNIHLVDLQYNGTSALMVPASGSMGRPALISYSSSGYYFDLSNANGASSMGFGWPLGSQIRPGGSPAPQYTFAKVVEFDPQGSARIFSSANPSSYPDAITPYIEIGLQPSQGGAAAGVSQSGNAGQIAAIQINGITGAVHIYRP
jgi:prepilin-type N-terminal cleavage/methylation domain-containing protein